MKTLLLFLFLFLSTTFYAGAQVAVPIGPIGPITDPVAALPILLVDNATITFNPVSHVLSCVIPPFAWPAGISYDGVNLSVPGLVITGNAAPADGVYLTTFKSGVVSYIPYVPPISPSPTKATFQVTGVPSVIPASQTITYIVPTSIPITSGSPLRVTPVADPGAPFAWVAVVSGPSQVTVRIWNRTASSASLPAGTWNLWIN